MSKQVDWPYVINLGNSIIGVSVLAMPFCFKECGLLLGMLLLLGCAWLAGVSCSLLMKAAVASKKRSYEFLALHVFGRAGKLAVELSIMGLLLGTCIAFYVVIGDLGPAILSKMFNMENTPNLRSAFMVSIALFVALPLGLLKNVESLSNVSAISLGFYCVFVAEVFSAAFPNLWSGVWVTKVVLWNPEGVFKCLPIFSLAFGCQTQLFVMYDALPEPSLSRMSAISKNAVSLCTGVYLCVGYFGYVAFCDEEIAGDILMNFRPTIFSEAVKLGFVMSVAVSFPLVIFPCRTSIHSLLFAKSGTHENFGGSPIIPEPQFKLITFSIIVITLIIGILIPNIEFVLALTGATMGALICFIFPAVMFISLMSMSNTGSKSTAQVVLFLGVTILLASTYVTLYSEEKGSSSSVVKMPVPHDHIDSVDSVLQNDAVQGPKGKLGTDEKEDGSEQERDKSLKAIEDVGPKIQAKGGDKKTEDEKEDKRQEPPIPHAPIETGETKDEGDTEGKGKDKADKDSKDGIGGMKKEKGVNINDTKTNELDKEKSPVADTDKAKSDDKKKNVKDVGDEKEAVDKEEKKDEGKNNEETGKLLEELKAQREEQQDLINQQKAIIAELQRHKDEAHPKQEGDDNANQKQEKDGKKVENIPQNLGQKQEPQIQKQVQNQPAQQQQIQEQNIPQQPLPNQQAAKQQQMPVHNQQPIIQQQALQNQQLNQQQPQLQKQKPVAQQQPLQNQQQQLLQNQQSVNQEQPLQNQQPLQHLQPVNQQAKMNPQQPLQNQQPGKQEQPIQNQQPVQYQQPNQQLLQNQLHQQPPKQNQRLGNQQQPPRNLQQPLQNQQPILQNMPNQNQQLPLQQQPVAFNRVADGNIIVNNVMQHDKNRLIDGNRQNLENNDKNANAHIHLDKGLDHNVENQRMDRAAAAG